MIHCNADYTALLEAFKRALLAEDASSNTTDAYLSDISHFITWYMRNFRAFSLSEVIPSDIREYREFLQEQVPPAAPATINRRLAALRRFFAWTKERQFTEAQEEVIEVIGSHCYWIGYMGKDYFIHTLT
jgi:site-specific recombinase XerD